MVPSLREERRPEVFENMILRRIFGPKNGVGLTVRSFIVCTILLARVIKSRILRWTGYAASVEEGRRALKILTRTPTGKKPSKVLA